MNLPFANIYQNGCFVSKLGLEMLKNKFMKLLCAFEALLPSKRTILLTNLHSERFSLFNSTRNVIIYLSSFKLQFSCTFTRNYIDNLYSFETLLFIYLHPIHYLDLPLSGTLLLILFHQEGYYWFKFIRNTQSIVNKNEAQEHQSTRFDLQCKNINCVSIVL